LQDVAYKDFIQLRKITSLPFNAGFDILVFTREFPQKGDFNRGRKLACISYDLNLKTTGLKSVSISSTLTSGLSLRLTNASVMRALALNFQIIKLQT
jgi:hypothetical protein